MDNWCLCYKVLLHWFICDLLQTSREVMVPADADVTGSCGEDVISMTLHVTDQDGADANGTLTFTFENDKGYTLLSECEFSFSFNDSEFLFWFFGLFKIET